MTAARRDRNRQAMPLASRETDALRAVLGRFPPFCRFTENGHQVEYGERVPDREVPRVPGIPEPRVPVVVVASITQRPVVTKRRR